MNGYEMHCCVLQYALGCRFATKHILQRTLILPCQHGSARSPSACEDNLPAHRCGVLYIKNQPISSMIVESLTNDAIKNEIYTQKSEIYACNHAIKEMECNDFLQITAFHSTLQHHNQ